MVEYLPPENNAVSSLLAIISDPESAQKRLDEINKSQADLNAKVDAARLSEESAKAAQAAADKSLEEQQDLKKYNEEVLSKQQADLKDKIDSYDLALKEHQSRVTKELQELNQQKQNNVDKELELSQRESSVSQREIAVSEREKETAGVKEEYEKKLDAASRLFVR